MPCVPEKTEIAQRGDTVTPTTSMLDALQASMDVIRLTVVRMWALSRRVWSEDLSCSSGERMAMEELRGGCLLESFKNLRLLI